MSTKKPRPHRPEIKSTASLSSTRPLLRILTVGLAFRIIYNIGLAGSLFFENYILDSVVLHNWALDIMNGTTANRAFFRAPLYPYTVAALYSLFGVSQWTVVIFQNILGMLTAVTMYFFARRIFDTRIAFWTGLITAAFPTLIYYEGELMTTALEAFLYTLTAYRIWLAVEKPETRNLILAGLVFGLAAITRPTILPLGIIFPVAYALRHGWREVKPLTISTAILAAATLGPILPVTFVNYVKGGEFVLISTQGGVNFYIGNNQKADGISVKAVGPDERIGPYQDNIWTSSVDEANRRTGKTLSESEVSSFWFNEGLKDVFADPGRALVLNLRKVWYFFQGQEIFNNKSMYYARDYSLLMKVLLWPSGLKFPSGLLFPLMVVGLVFAVWDRMSFFVPGAFIGGYALVIAAFFVCDRFRLPIVPLAVMGGVLGAYKLAQSAHLNRGRFVVGSTVGLSLLFLLNLGGNVESTSNQSQFNMVLGSFLLKEGQTESGIDHLRLALDAEPGNMGVYEPLGRAYLEAGRITEAEAVYRAGWGLLPTYPHFNYGLGCIEEMYADTSLAVGHFREVLHSAPGFAPAAEHLARIFEAQGRLDSALSYFEWVKRNAKPNPALDQKIQELRRQSGASSDQ